VATVIEPNASGANVRRAELSQLRSKYLKQDRILGPAWLMLLRLGSRMVSSLPTEVCDLISIPAVSASTAQRCLDFLLATGLVSLASGPGKRFRSVQISPLVYQELKALLAKIDDADALEQDYCCLSSFNGERT